MLIGGWSNFIQMKTHAATKSSPLGHRPAYTVTGLHKLARQSGPDSDDEVAMSEATLAGRPVSGTGQALTTAGTTARLGRSFQMGGLLEWRK
ncbi:hypothetical protein KEM52_004222 [Ascosphaera acerosa]|nr:hypothetical protein KEM52_004222 [Ascosphaera acerosa]